VVALVIETTKHIRIYNKNIKKMKKTIAIAALIIAIGTSVFAATPAKPKVTSDDASVSFTALTGKIGFDVKVAAEKSMIIIYDLNHDVIYKDRLSKGLPAEKGYVIGHLDDGDYTVEVQTENADVVKKLHVYDNGQGKDWFFMQQ
jgi:hypothetical protein